MLRIYTECLTMVREVGALLEEVAKHDRDLVRQLKRSSVSVALNVSEGCAVRDGRRRARYGDALGSVMETTAGLEISLALGYVRALPAEMMDRLDHITAVLVKLTR